MTRSFALASFCLTLTFAIAGPVSAAEVFQCELPSLTGGAAQANVFELSGKTLARRGGSKYAVLADDRDTIVAAAFDWAPETAMVVIVRSTGLLKLTAITNDRVQNPAYFGSCKK